MKQKIPFLDLGRLHQSIRRELDAAISEVIDSSSFIGGVGARFEERFAEAHGAPAAAGCGSGTDALVLALRAFGVGKGDDVVVPSMTFIATAEAVVLAGATPVLADVDPLTLLLTAEEVARVRTPATKAVVPVHLYGHVLPAADLQAMRYSGLVVIEDAAQAHLGSADGAMVGSIGHAATFSFYPGKNLGALGDGGAVISADAAAIDEIKRLRDHGRTSKYEHEVVGMNSRLDGIHAAVLEVKLGHLQEWTDARRALAEQYRLNLGQALIPWSPGAVHHLLVARPGNRERTLSQLAREGIGSGVHYPIPLSRQPAMSAWIAPCPASEEASASIVSLPMDPLLTPGEVDRVCDLVLECEGPAIES